VTQIQNNKGRK